MEEATIKSKLDFYKGKPIEVHIVKKKVIAEKPSQWLNCFVLEEESPGVYLVKDRKFGVVRIFLGEIFFIEEYEVRGVGI